MYKINTKVDKPDIEYMRDRIKEMVTDGIRITDNIEEIANILNTDLVNNKKQIERYGIKNPNSSVQVLDYLKSLDDPIVEEYCTDVKGKWSSNGDNLRKLAHAGYDFAVDLLTYRKSTSYMKAVNQVKDFREEDGCVRPLVGYGKTNRVNYKQPALMNIPKELVWDLISASEEGNVLISADIKNQEPWILINMLNIESLKDALKSNEQGGLYNILYKKIFGAEPNEIQRKEFKTSWNALTYGSAKKSIVDSCRNIDGAKVFKYFSSIKELAEYKDKCYKLAHKNNKKASTIFGTEVFADSNVKGHLKRQLMDLPIQGTGADVLALLIKHFDDEMDKRGLVDKLWIYFTRHDELIIEVSKDAWENIGEKAIFEMLKDIFEHQIDDWQPFEVKISKLEKRGIQNNSLMQQYMDEDDEFIV